MDKFNSYEIAHAGQEKCDLLTGDCLIEVVAWISSIHMKFHMQDKKKVTF